jgi:hypothetical protein
VQLGREQLRIEIGAKLGAVDGAADRPRDGRVELV